MDLASILVATDFSPCSGAAFQTAASLARTFRAKLIVLHVINQKRLNTLASYLQVDHDNLLPGLRQQAEQKLSDFLARYNGEGLEVESLVAVGLPFQQIAIIARELDVDLVALGGYGQAGRGPLEEIFFGSTAEKVVRLLPCPVLCVPLPPAPEDN